MKLRKQMNTQEKEIGRILLWTNADIKWSIWHAAQNSFTLIQAVEERQGNQLKVNLIMHVMKKNT